MIRQEKLSQWDWPLHVTSQCLTWLLLFNQADMRVNENVYSLLLLFVHLPVKPLILIYLFIYLSFIYLSDLCKLEKGAIQKEFYFSWHNFGMSLYYEW